MSTYQQMWDEQMRRDGANAGAVKRAGVFGAAALAIIWWFIPGILIPIYIPSPHNTGDDWRHNQPGIVHDTGSDAPPIVIGWPN